MNNEIRITEYPIKVLGSKFGHLENIGNVQGNTKIDWAFANIMAQEGPCTMFKVPIATLIFKQDKSLLFELKTQNNFDIYNFQAQPDIMHLEDSIEKAHKMHLEIFKTMISTTAFRAMPPPDMNLAQLRQALLQDMARMYETR